MLKRLQEEPGIWQMAFFANWQINNWRNQNWNPAVSLQELIVGAEQHFNTLPKGSEKKNLLWVKRGNVHPVIAWHKCLIYNKLPVAIFSLQIVEVWCSRLLSTKSCVGQFVLRTIWKQSSKTNVLASMSLVSKMDVQKEASSPLSLSKPTQRFLELLLKHKIK